MRNGETTSAWAGEYRGTQGIPPLTSPIDRPPHRVTVNVADVPDLDTASARPVVFREWCGWVFVEDAGGNHTYLLPDGATPILIAAGRTMWIGKARCSIGYSGSAPTRPVALVGCTGPDALIMASGSGSSSSSSGAVPNGTDQESMEMDGTVELYLPPTGTEWTVVTIYDGGTSCAVGTDPTDMNVDIGPGAQLSSWTHYGEGPIYFQGVNTEWINFINYTLT